MVWQATILSVLLQTLQLGSTTPTAPHANGPYLVTGLLIAPHSPADNTFEVSLTDEGGLLVAELRSHGNQRFTFSQLRAGTYYLVVDAPGFRPMRQRVDVRGIELETSELLVLEPQEPSVGGKRLDFSGETNAAIHVAELAQPGAYEAHKELGAAYQMSGRYSEAEKEFRIARDLRPSSAAPLISLGSLYLVQVEKGSPKAATLLDDAREVLLAALALNPEASFGHYLLGVASYKAGLYSDAQKHLLRALKLEPKFGSARLALANLHIRLQDWTAAVSELDAYLKANPKTADRAQIQAKRAQLEEIRRKAAVSGLAR
jgi:tetratricopeptide (TPR) repeat protein